MSFCPAMSGEVRGNARAEKRNADGERADDPAEFHVPAQEAEVEDAKDENKDGSFGEEGGAAT